MIDKIIHGDCLEILPEIDSQSVDMVLCDLPYGITDANWDSVIPLEPLWKEYGRIVKPKGAIVLTASQPFASRLIMSKPKWFRHEWIWVKNKPSNFFHAKRMPLKKHESILVFGKQSPNYYPIKTDLHKRNKAADRPLKNPHALCKSGSIHKRYLLYESIGRFPTTILEFPKDKERLHPTQKPIGLFQYLIKTYTQEGDTVLDNCIGCGTTAIAAITANRHFIGIEKDKAFHRLAMNRTRLAIASDMYCLQYRAA